MSGKQYLIWVGNGAGAAGFCGLIQGNFGWSFEFEPPRWRNCKGTPFWMTYWVNLAGRIVRLSHRITR